MQRYILTTAALGGLLAMAAAAGSQEEPAVDPAAEPAASEATVETRPETFLPGRVGDAPQASSTEGFRRRATTTPRVQVPVSGPGPGYAESSSWPMEYRLRSAAGDPERKVQELVRDWKAAVSDDVRGAAEDDLRKALAEEFAARMDQHAKQIEDLEARVKTLREQLERRREKQDDIIDFRLQELLREAQGLGWGGEPVRRGGDPFMRGGANVGGGPGDRTPGAAPEQLARPRSR